MIQVKEPLLPLIITTVIETARTLHKKLKFSIKAFFRKHDKIRRKLRIWSHLLKKSLIENFIFCAVAIEARHTRNTRNAWYFQPWQ